MFKKTLLGLAVGDALGVPYEFRTKNQMINSPCTDMVGYGTYNQPPGTWSDDTSMALCICDAMLNRTHLPGIQENFRKWLLNEEFTPYGEVFDFGCTTSVAINTGKGVYSASNGCLMRTIPVAVFAACHYYNKMELRILSDNIAGITNIHQTALDSCFFFNYFAQQLIYCKNKYEAFSTSNKIAFGRLEDVTCLKESEVRSSGLAYDILELSLWCLLNSESYEEAVLKAINFGNDTDTAGAVTGALASIIYDVPEKWISKLARVDYLQDLGQKLDEAFYS